jgi:hypothetical protein
VMCSNNDELVRSFDAETFQLVRCVGSRLCTALGGHSPQHRCSRHGCWGRAPHSCPTPALLPSPPSPYLSQSSPAHALSHILFPSPTFFGPPHPRTHAFPPPPPRHTRT